MIEDILKELSADEAFNHMIKITEKHPMRLAGSEGLKWMAEYVNAAFETVYGYSPEEAIGQTPRILKSGLVPQEGYERFWKALLNKS